MQLLDYLTSKDEFIDTVGKEAAVTETTVARIVVIVAIVA